MVAGLLVLSACTPDVGPCDPFAAREIVYLNTGIPGDPNNGTPMFAGQALMQVSCGDGRFCHANAATDGERYGVPVGLDFDFSVPCDASGCVPGAVQRLRANQAVAFDARHHILQELQRKQKVVELAVTIPEGRNILEVARILADAGLGDAAQLEAAMRDRELLDALGISGPTAEGYLFPDTYKFRQGATAKDVITRLVKRHREVFAELRRRHGSAARELKDELGWGDHEVVILASIVEKETAAVDERPLIAGVFLNRLRFSSFTPKLLQTDPTIIYGCTVPEQKSEACQQFEGRIRRIHLRDPDNPYSTYAHEGLPPGPISNPGREALEAVLAPTKSRYLYFVARNDGTHEFSKTVAEHEKWVDLYQRKGQVGKPK